MVGLFLFGERVRCALLLVVCCKPAPLSNATPPTPLTPSRPLLPRLLRGLPHYLCLH